MKKRALVVLGMAFAVALVIVGAAEARAGVDAIDFGFGDACQATCAAQYMSDLAGCSELGGRARSMCRRDAQADSRACLEACPD